MEGVSERVMVAAFLEKPEAGQVLEGLPAHLTYVSWFNASPENRERLYDRIADIVEEERPPTIKGTILQYFSDDTNTLTVPVRKLDQMSPGFHFINDFAAHAALVEFAKRSDPAFDPEYFGLNWNPHVSVTPEYELGQGEEARLNNLTVIRKDRELGRKVIDRVIAWERFENE